MAHLLRQLQNLARRDTIARMNTITLLLSIAAVILSGGALSVSLSTRTRLEALEARESPDMQTKGAGGGGW